MGTKADAPPPAPLVMTHHGDGGGVACAQEEQDARASEMMTVQTRITSLQAELGPSTRTPADAEAANQVTPV